MKITDSNVENISEEEKSFVLIEDTHTHKIKDRKNQHISGGELVGDYGVR